LDVGSNYQFKKGYLSLEKNKKANFQDFKFLWEFTAGSKNKYLENETITTAIESDKKQAVYYCFKKLFSVSYAAIVSKLK